MNVWFYPNLQDTLALVIIFIIYRLISKVYRALKLWRTKMYASDM